MDRSEVMNQMRGRIRLCRNLAAATADPRTAAALHQMADEGERDLRRLEAEQSDLD